MIFESNGQKYIKIGDKAIPFDDYDESGNPIIKPKIEKITHPDGRTDVKVKITSLRINA